jgi:hypothetical protein
MRKRKYVKDQCLRTKVQHTILLVWLIMIFIFLMSWQIFIGIHLPHGILKVRLRVSFFPLFFLIIVF